MTESSGISTSRTGLSFPDTLRAVFPLGPGMDRERFDRIRMEGGVLLRTFTDQAIGSPDIPQNVMDAIPAFEDVLTLGLDDMAMDRITSFDDDGHPFAEDMLRYRRDALSRESLYDIYGRGISHVDMGRRHDSDFKATVSRGKHFLGDDYDENMEKLKNYQRSVRLFGHYLRNEPAKWPSQPNFPLQGKNLDAVLVDQVLCRLIMEKLFFIHATREGIVVQRGVFSARRLLWMFAAMLRFTESGGDSPWDADTAPAEIFPWAKTLDHAEQSSLFRMVSDVRRELKKACASVERCRKVLWMFDREDDAETLATQFFAVISPGLDNDYDAYAGGKQWPVYAVNGDFMGVFLLMLAVGQDTKKLPMMVDRHDDGRDHEAVLASLFREVAAAAGDTPWNVDRVERFLLLESPPESGIRREWKNMADSMAEDWRLLLKGDGESALVDMVFLQSRMHQYQE